MFGIKDKVARTAKRAGLISAGTVCCTVGVGFLTASGWLALAPTVGPATAAFIIAGVYIGVGLILIALGANDPATQHRPPAAAEQPKTATQAPPLMQAFMFGMETGVKADKRRR
ncbi:hypothetical protein FHS72_003628 [Loktanella ponticola]|uniref:Phage holin family protein n=1 Tax=Yoonia ponticola TaxID=1524255 RepID=A0A7W9BNZ3_9RHOB|nr:phage holin family protein [Yoonia ponticola]MBB5723980.1 hypothetical protein [Yoonia ponticola]